MINSNIDTIDNIFHISDVHVRNLKRHDEYAEVFNRLYAYLRANVTENSIICVTGDVAHSKTDISPELVQIISSFYSTLADIAPVVTILGNHDCNITNKNRLDVLSPILSSLNHKNIWYMKDTGTYDLANVRFVVWSVLDSKSNYPLANQIDRDGKLLVLLYHGLVDTVELDTGLEISNRAFKLDMFDGFDMVLLGDIHKRQLLQESSVTTMEIDSDELNYYRKLGWEINE